MRLKRKSLKTKEEEKNWSNLALESWVLKKFNDFLLRLFLCFQLFSWSIFMLLLYCNQITGSHIINLNHRLFHSNLSQNSVFISTERNESIYAWEALQFIGQTRKISYHHQQENFSCASFCTCSLPKLPISTGLQSRMTYCE